MTFHIILVTAIPDFTDPTTGTTVSGNTITEVRQFDKLANALAFVASHDPTTVVAFQVYKALP